jgi:RNA polymerase II subunit A-like phosphatase
MIAPMYGNGAQILSKSFRVSSLSSPQRSLSQAFISDDFFVGIGDINSTFLPKIEPLTLSPPPQPSTSGTKGPPSAGAETEATTIKPEAPSVAPPSSSTTPSTPEQERAELTAKAMLTQNSLALEAQLEERPLAKKQEALQEGINHEPHHHSHPKSEEKPAGTGSEKKEDEGEKRSTTPGPEKVKQKALLKNDDFELERVATVCGSHPNQNVADCVNLDFCQAIG